MATSITIAAFDEIRHPDKVEFGVTGGPGWNTTIITTPSGFEQRNQNWENARRRFRFQFHVPPSDAPDDFDDLLNFFNARRGRLRGFRFRDWTDYEASAQVCVQYNDLDEVVGDGVETEFQTAKLYDDGVNPFRRIIKKPIIESGDQADPDDSAAQVFLDTGGGPSLLTRGVDYSFDTETGKITFLITPPAVNDVVTWTGRFDVPARYDTDDFNTVLESFNNFEWPDLSVVELRIPQV